MENPWGRLARLTDWLIAWAHLPGEVMGLTHHEARVIVLDRRLTQAERRCTLAHELQHVEHGPAPDDPVLIARDELRVDRATARRMIPIHALGDALSWSTRDVEVADELWVDVPTLQARLRSLHPSERAYLLRRTEHHRDHH